jgi:methionine--tRNA ligase beta chain
MTVASRRNARPGERPARLRRACQVDESKAPVFAPVKPVVTLAVLDQLDVRVGLIEAAADVAGSDKLIELAVDFGGFKRAILVGMKKEREDPTELVGRQALFVVNLAPRRMAGRVSEGMLFDIGFADGICPALAVPEYPVPNGARAG